MIVTALDWPDPQRSRMGGGIETLSQKLRLYIQNFSADSIFSAGKYMGLDWATNAQKIETLIEFMSGDQNQGKR